MKQFQLLERKSCIYLNLLRWKYIISIKILLFFSQKKKLFMLRWWWKDSAGTPARDQKQGILLFLFLCSDINNRVTIQRFPLQIRGNHVTVFIPFYYPKMCKWARLRKIKCSFSYLKGRTLVWNRTLQNYKWKLSLKFLLHRHL